jgi:hypothetical protein
MIVEKTLRQKLENREPGGFHFHAGDWHVTFAAERSDSLSCALKELALKKNVPIREELRTWAERVAKQATGLLESLCLIEVDHPMGKALLRSEPPIEHGGQSFYYELLLGNADHASAHLYRYAGYRNGKKREAVPFVLTHEAIVKLVNVIAGGK